MSPVNAAYTAHNILLCTVKDLTDQRTSKERNSCQCNTVAPTVDRKHFTEEQHTSMTTLLQRQSAACCVGKPGISGLELKTERHMKAPAVSEVLRIVEDDFIVDGEG